MLLKWFTKSIFLRSLWCDLHKLISLSWIYDTSTLNAKREGEDVTRWRCWNLNKSGWAEKIRRSQPRGEIKTGGKRGKNDQWSGWSPINRWMRAANNSDSRQYWQHTVTVLTEAQYGLFSLNGANSTEQGLLLFLFSGAVRRESFLTKVQSRREDTALIYQVRNSEAAL